MDALWTLALGFLTIAVGVLVGLLHVMWSEVKTLREKSHNMANQITVLNAYHDLDTIGKQHERQRRKERDSQ